MKSLFFSFSFILLLACGSDDEKPIPPQGDAIQLSALRVGSLSILTEEITTAPLDKPVVCTFSKSLEVSTVPSSIQISAGDNTTIAVTISYLDEGKTVSLQPQEKLKENTLYTVRIKNSLEATDGSTFAGFSRDFTTINFPLEVVSSEIDGHSVGSDRISGVSFSPKVKVTFSHPVVATDVADEVSIVGTGRTNIPMITQESPNTLVFSFNDKLEGYQKYQFKLSGDITVDNRSFEAYDFTFYTKLDSSTKFPEISDDELLTKIQEQTFKYFYDFAHPISGLARERNSSGDVVTTGGSGFGLMALIVGIDRGFISRSEGVDRIEKIVDFLQNKAERFHGAWSHWLNGRSGSTIPFSSKDDGGDIVETAFLIQGLLTVRQYLDPSKEQESRIINNINTLWNEVEWSWFQQPGTNQITWHWSPRVGFDINLAVRGWNESLIVYVLAAGSPTHRIEAEVYNEGWARSGGMKNGNQYFGVTLPLGESRGGPLFFSHYSFLGLDPRKLSDQYANYWDQNVAHAQINQLYCKTNPLQYVGYSDQAWGLTACDNIAGYSAHSPTNDRGVIASTAAVSSIPYTPEESMKAIRHFYYILGDKLWGEYGFYDAFNITEGWYADSYLAIDQGPIIVMIENHRTGRLWDLFMSAPEIKEGLRKLNFTIN